MKTRVCLKYFENGYLCKRFFACNSPQTTSTLIFLTNFVTLSFLFQPKFKATKLQKSTKTCLDKYFPDLFTEIQIWYWKLSSLAWDVFPERQSKF